MRTLKLLTAFLSGPLIALALAAATGATDNSVFERAWTHFNPSAKPLEQQAVATQLAAKSYGEAVLWAQANPEPAPEQPPAGGARELIVSDSYGWFTSDTLPDDTTIRGKHWKAATASGEFEGLRLLGKAKRLTFEDCVIEGFGVNVNLGFGAQLEQVTFRHCLILSAAGDDHAQGVFAVNVKGLTFDGCLFWRNGEASKFSQGAYITNGNTGVVVTHCVFVGSGSYQLQVRCGGTVEWCIFIDNANGLRLGGGGDDGFLEPGIVVDVHDNLFVGGNPTPGVPRECLVTASNVKSGTILRTLLVGPSNGGNGPLELPGKQVGVGLGSLSVLEFYRMSWPYDPAVSPVSTGGKPWTGTIDQHVVEPQAFDRAPADALAARLLLRELGAWGEPYNTEPVILGARAQLGVP